jgi:hypothetical protein
MRIHHAIAGLLREGITSGQNPPGELFSGWCIIAATSLTSRGRRVPAAPRRLLAEPTWFAFMITTGRQRGYHAAGDP